ncbi:MAG: ATP phosphoribosyltransferase regulatory subunit [Gammaproteobacteria bacterium]|nr:ATP phosphoribosyltransferase regulatory subunit [Gammaproteobacteria bacterium]
MEHQNWRLPDGVDELLPPAAWALEQIRRTVLDVFHNWGFDYVEPPLIEYLDALLVGSGNDLDLQTLKAVDQRSGRLLGVRADMTSQAARMDAHSLKDNDVQRLCYAGTVVHANPEALLASRVPVKAGAEIFGSSSLAADAEVVALLVEVLHAVGVGEPVLVLGNMGIYHSLTSALGANKPLDERSERRLFQAVQSKSETDIADIAGDSPIADMLVRLPTLMGPAASVGDVRRALKSAPAEVKAALDSLIEFTEMVRQRCPDLALRYDVAELAGYGYHNGPVFSAYQAEQGRALARGGRYDGIGAAFGRSRPATGFDVSLKELLENSIAVPLTIWAPWAEGKNKTELLLRIEELRGKGERVLVALSEVETPSAACTKQLASKDGQWSVTDIV